MYCQRCGNALAPGARFCNACGTAVPEGAAAPSARKNSGAAAVVIALVALLGVVAFIGIVAAIAVPNFLTAKQRAMQRRTIADMRRVSITSVEEYRQSHNALP